MSEDLYSILGVDSAATVEEIKKAYRKKAHQYHPDKANGNEEEFKKVNEAYQVLSNVQKRQQYDQFGQTPEGFGGFDRSTGSWQGVNVNIEDLGDLGDIFGQFFSNSARGATRDRGDRVRRGNDVQIDVTIDFVESATGVTKEVTTRLYQTCSACHGNGAEPGTPIETCSQCRGSGQVSAARQTMLGVFTQASVCPTCHGEGKLAKKPCQQCRGEGRELKDRTLEITVPAGIDDGQNIRISSKGETPAHGGVAGDLYVTVHVTSHAAMRRDGNDIRSSVTISFVEASLGSTKTIETLQGEQKLTIPAGTQPGTELRLTGAGFPELGSLPSFDGASARQGDHIVTVNIEIPKKLSHKQRQLLEQFSSVKKGFFG
jgi:molecular chaperone DnaJ